MVHLAGGTSLDVRLGLTGGTDSGYRFSRKVGTSLKFARGQLTGGTSLYVRLGLTGGTDSWTRRPGWNDGWHQFRDSRGRLTGGPSLDWWHQFALATVGSLSTDWNDGWHRFRGRLTGGLDLATRSFRRIICRVAPVWIPWVAPAGIPARSLCRVASTWVLLGFQLTGGPDSDFSEIRLTGGTSLRSPPSARSPRIGMTGGTDLKIRVQLPGDTD